MTQLDLVEEVKGLTERLEWLLQELKDKELLSEVVWFIHNNYRSKFLKEKK